MEKKDTRNLKFRYLLWFYKITREEVDRIERKFTQLDIDRAMFDDLKEKIKPQDDSGLKKYLEEFKEYINKKEKDAKALKYEEEELRADYHFLILKLEAVEKVIVEKLGAGAKKQIKSLYEEEMRRRILESKEHK